MKKFIITIEEMFSNNFEINAENIEDAMRIAEEKYNNHDYIINQKSLVCKQMSVAYPSDEVTEWIEF